MMEVTTSQRYEDRRMDMRRSWSRERRSCSRSRNERKRRRSRSRSRSRSKGRKRYKSRSKSRRSRSRSRQRRSRTRERRSRSSSRYKSKSGRSERDWRSRERSVRRSRSREFGRRERRGERGDTYCKDREERQRSRNRSRSRTKYNQDDRDTKNRVSGSKERRRRSQERRFNKERNKGRNPSDSGDKNYDRTKEFHRFDQNGDDGHQQEINKHGISGHHHQPYRNYQGNIEERREESQFSRGEFKGDNKDRSHHEDRNEGREISRPQTPPIGSSGGDRDQSSRLNIVGKSFEEIRVRPDLMGSCSSLDINQYFSEKIGSFTKQVKHSISVDPRLNKRKELIEDVYGTFGDKGLERGNGGVHRDNTQTVDILPANKQYVDDIGHGDNLMDMDQPTSSKVSYSGVWSQGEGGVSPPRTSEGEPGILLVEDEARFEVPAEPVFLDIYSQDGVTISRIKVYLYNHAKCQLLQDKEHGILVGSFLRYLKKYYPTPRVHQKMVLVTSCPPAYGLLIHSLATQPENKRIFESYFHQWTDLTTLVSRHITNTRESGPRLLAVEYKSTRTEQLLRQVRHPTVSTTTDSVLMMKEVLDEVVSGTKPREQDESQFDSCKLLSLATPCRLTPSNYLVVVLQLGLIEREGVGPPILGTIGFRNSHRGSWFVPLDPGRVGSFLTTNISSKSAEDLGFRKDGGAAWIWGEEGSLACLGEVEALLCFLSALQAERTNSGTQAMVLVTARREERALGVLVAALTRSGHLHTFLQLVSGLGDMEQLATMRGVQLSRPGLTPYSLYWQRSHGRELELSKAENIPKSVYQVLESLLGGSPTYENLVQPFLHPIISPYTNSLLLSSKVPELREDHYRVLLLARVSIKPHSMELVNALLEGVPRTDAGHEFLLVEGGQVKFGWNKVKLAVNCHLGILIQNPGSGSLTLDKGQHLGWATRSELVESSPQKSSYVPSNFSYSQLGRDREITSINSILAASRNFQLKPPSPQPHFSPSLKPPSPSLQFKPPSPPHIFTPPSPSPNLAQKSSNLGTPYGPYNPQLSHPSIPFGPSSPQMSHPSLPFGPPISQFSSQPNTQLKPYSQNSETSTSKTSSSPCPPRIPLERPPSRDPRGPRHNKPPLPGSWGLEPGPGAWSLDPLLAKAHRNVSSPDEMASSHPPFRPPSPTVHPEKESLPKPKSTRDPRLNAVRIERKSAMPLSKKILEDRGISQPLGNPKYFSHGDQFSPIVNLVPGSGSRVSTAEDRQSLFGRTPQTDVKQRTFKNEFAHIGHKEQERKKKHKIINGSSCELGNRNGGDTSPVHEASTGKKDIKMTEGLQFIPLGNIKQREGKKKIKTSSSGVNIVKKNGNDSKTNTTHDGIKERNLENLSTSNKNKKRKSVSEHVDSNIEFGEVSKKSNKKKESIQKIKKVMQPSSMDINLKDVKKVSKKKKVKLSPDGDKNVLESATLSKKDEGEPKFVSQKDAPKSVNTKAANKIKKPKMAKEVEKEEFELPVKTTSKKILNSKPKKKKIETPSKAPLNTAKVVESVVLREDDNLKDEFIGSNSPVSHSSSDTSDSDDSPFEKICPLCKEIFKSLQTYKTHYRSPHTFKCGHCKLMFNREDKLEDHVEKTHNESPEKESEVDFETEIMEILDSPKRVTDDADAAQKVNIDHISESTTDVDNNDLVIDENNELLEDKINIDKVETKSNEEVDSKYCQKHCCAQFRGFYTSVVPNVVTFDDVEIPVIEEVIKEESEEDEFPCKKCSAAFPSERDLFEHSLRAHQDGWSYANSPNKVSIGDGDPSGPFLCGLCGEIIKSWTVLVKHLWQPHLFKCTYCDRAYNRNTKLEDHQNNVHNLVGLIEVTQCGLCGENFARSSSLARHVSTPHPFPCLYCEAKFQTVKAQKKHMCAKSVVTDIINICLDSIGST